MEPPLAAQLLPLFEKLLGLHRAVGRGAEQGEASRQGIAPQAGRRIGGGGTGSFPGLHQVGVVELVCADGKVRPYFRSVPGVIESEVYREPEFAAAWEEAGAGPLPGRQ